MEQNRRSKKLYAVDELSGFVIAVARVRPNKSIHEVDVAAVKKKMKDKAFARAVNREDIVHGAAGIEMPLENLIAQVIAALQADAERLGLSGSSPLRIIMRLTTTCPSGQLRSSRRMKFLLDQQADVFREAWSRQPPRSTPRLHNKSLGFTSRQKAPDC